MNNDLISRSELLKQFENLKEKSETLRDVIYLDGVMAVIENVPTANTERRENGQMNNWISVNDRLPEPPKEDEQ